MTTMFFKINSSNPSNHNNHRANRHTILMTIPLKTNLGTRIANCIQGTSLQIFLRRLFVVYFLNMVRSRRQKSFERIVKELQPLKDYCYGFVLMQEGEGAMNAVIELKQNSPLGTSWTVAFSKDKNDGEISGNGNSKNSEKKSKDDKIKKKDKSKERMKKDKTKLKKKDKKKKKSDSSSSDSSKSRGRSAKKSKKIKRKRASSSSESNSPKFPARSALIKVEQKPAVDNNLMEMLFMQPDQLQQQLGQPPVKPMQQQAYQIKNQIWVRELFISGIPQNKTAQDIQRIFSQYGIIERVDIMIKQLVNYAYVKYKRIESVIAAIQASNMIADLLESNGQVKIYNSDPFRRVQIVGNAEDSEKDEEMVPVMFIGYPSNPNYTVDEVFLKKLAVKYGGTVKGIQHVLPDHPQLRSYILIEFADLKDCKKARRKFCHYKIQILGDKKCDVAVLSNLPQSLQNKRQQFMPQQQTQQYVQQPQQQHQMYNNYNQMNRQQQVQSMIPQPLPTNPQMPYNQYQQQQQMIYQQMIPQPPMPQQQLYNPASIVPLPTNMMTNTTTSIPQQQQQYQQQQQRTTQSQQQQPQQQGYYYSQQQQSSSKPTDIMNFLPQPQSQGYNMSQYPIEYQQPQQSLKIDDQPNVFWSGFMNRGRQHRVAIDARVFQSNIDLKKVNLPHNLEMSFKCTFQDALNKAQSQQAVIMVINPATEGEVPKFNEYISYLKSKSRAGVIQNDDFTVYVVPPGIPEGQQIYNLSGLEMIAVYCPK